MQEKKILTFGLFYLLLISSAFSQTLSTPHDFLGYPLGKRFTFHHQMLDYFEYLAKNSDKIQIHPYGESYEGRKLVTAFISSSENMQHLEEIRKNNLRYTGLLEGTSEDKGIPIVWLSYNVHGNEASGMEAAIQTAYHLVSQSDSLTKNWLDNLLIVIDPCENPDGHERYVTWYTNVQGNLPDPSPFSWEHHEPFPGGRFNHYLFDLNRDWAWQTQVESQQRVQYYQQWMPQIHADIHEMNYQNTYFFAPAAPPFHEDITPWQRKFQEYLGKNHAHHFNVRHELYFTGEVYDLFYPSYGDTYPTFHGAIGLTYEQGGQRGVAIKRQSGDTLTLKRRIDNHVTTSLSTIETTCQYRKEVIQEFKDYFKKPPVGKYKSYVIKCNMQETSVQALLNLLDKQQIRYAHPKKFNKNYQGFDYKEQKVRSFRLDSNDIIISMYQPKSVLVKVLFEPEAMLEDSLTYDLTAWALPYAYNLEGFAVEDEIAVKKDSSEMIVFQKNVPIEKEVYAYLMKWKDVKNVQFLADLMQRDIRVRYTEEVFVLGKQTFQPGTLVLMRADNPHLVPVFDSLVCAKANQYMEKLYPIFSGKMDLGKDLGSSGMHQIRRSKIAVLADKGVVPTSLGAVWYYIEQELGYPVTILPPSSFTPEAFHQFSTLILPSGNYEKYNRLLLDFTKQGGKIIALGSAVNSLAQSQQLEIREKRIDTSEKSVQSILPKYKNRQRRSLTTNISGAIYRVTLDTSHPLAFGLREKYFTIKKEGVPYHYLSSKGWNVGVLGEKAYVSGFVGHRLKQVMKNTLAIGVEKYGQGNIIYFPDSPLFRGFWHTGKLLFGNALFLL